MDQRRMMVKMLSLILMAQMDRIKRQMLKLRQRMWDQTRRVVRSLPTQTKLVQINQLTMVLLTAVIKLLTLTTLKRLKKITAMNQVL